MWWHQTVRGCVEKCGDENKKSDTRNPIHFQQVIYYEKITFKIHWKRWLATTMTSHYAVECLIKFILVLYELYQSPLFFIENANNRLLCIFMASINLQLFSWKFVELFHLFAGWMSKKGSVDSTELASGKYETMKLTTIQQSQFVWTADEYLRWKVVDDADDAWAGNIVFESVRNELIHLDELEIYLKPKTVNDCINCEKLDSVIIFVLFRFFLIYTLAFHLRRGTERQRCYNGLGFSYSSNFIQFPF